MTKQLPFIKPRLFSPGPTPVPLRSLLATVEQTAYHRCSAFYTSFLKCRELLAPFFGNHEPPLILTCSGTGAMEAAVVNLTAVGDEVLCLVGGKFGERWSELNQAYQCQVHELKFGPDEGPELSAISECLKRYPKIKAVFFQANETSTGMALPVADIAACIKGHSKALVVVDAISALGAHKIAMSDWGLDAVVSGSQKGFGTPPGLAFIALSKQAQVSLSKRPRFYFDFEQEWLGQKNGQSAFTPATTLVACLQSSLEALHQVGLDEMLAYHAKVAAGVRAALTEIGFTPLVKRHWSHALTAVYLPAGVDYLALNQLLRDKYAETFAGGQGSLKGKILRFAHLGLFDYFDIIAAIAALEQSLHTLGQREQLGQGVAKFMACLSESGL